MREGILHLVVTGLMVVLRMVVLRHVPSTDVAAAVTHGVVETL